MNSPSFTKLGDIFITPCNFTEALFPLNQSPYNWRSCNDAYKYSWTKDFNRDVSSLSSLDSSKMINSMGFCPQNRCQLYNVSGSSFDGLCPVGLCYTKVENGGPSYGACCFHKGMYNSGVLIGYYNKTQPSPKPIYKKSRVVLGNIRGQLGGNDESIESFINANELYEGLIGTQCPLSSHPIGFENTVDNVKRMIIENNITLWIQLAPSGLEMYYKNGSYVQNSGNCGVFPLEYFIHGNTSYSNGISSFKITHNPSNPFIEMKYTVTAFTASLPDGRIKTVFDERVTSHRDTPTRHHTHLSPIDIRTIRHLRYQSIEAGQNKSFAMTDLQKEPENFVIIEMKDLQKETGEDHIREIHEIENDIENLNPEKYKLIDQPLSLINQPTSFLHEGEGIESASSDAPRADDKIDELDLMEKPLVWNKISVEVKHVWYHKWKDFKIPPPEDAHVKIFSMFV